MSVTAERTQKRDAVSQRVRELKNCGPRSLISDSSVAILVADDLEQKLRFTPSLADYKSVQTLQVVVFSGLTVDAIHGLIVMSGTQP